MKTPMQELFKKYGHLLPDIQSEYLQKESDYKIETPSEQGYNIPAFEGIYHQFENSDPTERVLNTKEDTMHTVTINLHACQTIKIKNKEINIHDLESIELNSLGYIVDYLLKENQKPQLKAFQTPSDTTAFENKTVVSNEFYSNEADIIRKAKEICFKTGYVRHKDWLKGCFSACTDTKLDLDADIVFVIRGDSYEPKKIVEEWESVDPLKD